MVEIFRWNQTLKHPIWWWWWRDFSLSIKPWTYLNSSTWQGIVIVPFWSNPYSFSASFSSCMNSGWLKYITGTMNLCCSSPWPTLTAKHPFGTSLTTCFLPWWWWRCGRCRWKFLRLLSPEPILPFCTKIRSQKNNEIYGNPSFLFLLLSQKIREKEKVFSTRKQKKRAKDLRWWLVWRGSEKSIWEIVVRWSWLMNTKYKQHTKHKKILYKNSERDWGEF